jgi:hypothetical protein
MRQCAEAVELRLEDEVGRIERTDRSIEAREALRLRVELAKARAWEMPAGLAKLLEKHRG